MPKHGTASQVTGIYVEFQAAVLRALPRDINANVASGWINNGRELARVLSEVLLPSSAQLTTEFTVPVDYTLNIERLVAAGHYDQTYGDITTDNFFLEFLHRRVSALYEMKLFGFNDGISTDEVLRALNTIGYRPANSYELLSLGAHRPELQRTCAIVGLGSTVRGPYRGRSALCLSMIGSRRVLYIRWIEPVWHKSVLFAALPI